MGCGCKTRSLGGLKSKSKLAAALYALGYHRAGDSARNCEAFGRRVFCFPCFDSVAQRRKAEDELAAEGFKVDRKYGGRDDPGRCASVQVSYFKAWHWNE